MAKQCLRLALAGIVALSLGAGIARANEAVYRIRPGTTTIGFSVDHMGMFTTEGSFGAFQGDLLLNLDDPSRSHVDVQVDTSSVEVESDEAEALLTSPAYFDPPKYPLLRFKAQNVTSLGDGRVRIEGDLTVRDVTRPQVLVAELKQRRFDPALQAEVADFVVSGTMERSQFGMTADQDFVSDEVILTINSHIRLLDAPPAPSN